MTRPMFQSVTVGRYSDGSPVQISRADAAGLDIQGRKNREKGAIYVIQGGHHLGSQSANTHAKWRVADIGFLKGRVTAGQHTAWAPFHRTQADGFDEHIHQCLLIKDVADDTQIDALAAAQIAGYRQNPPRDGLGSWPFGDYRGPNPPEPRAELDWQAYVEGRYTSDGDVVSKARARRVMATLRHNADINRTVRRLRAARRKAQNPKIRRRLEQVARELLGMRIRPQVDIDLIHQH